MSVSHLNGITRCNRAHSSLAVINFSTASKWIAGENSSSALTMLEVNAPRSAIREVVIVVRMLKSVYVDVLNNKGWVKKNDVD